MADESGTAYTPDTHGDSNLISNSTQNNNLIGKETEEPKESIPPPQVTFPNGGLVAWLNREFLSEHSPSQISWIGSVQVFLQFFLAPISGRLTDNGYFNHLLLFSSILLVFSMFMLSLAHPHHYYEVFLPQALGQGIAMGCMFLPSVTILAQYFSVRRSIVMGLGVSG
ncbi:hypothetical protein Clacol_008937 [Clathrus columnatus]|uniref:Major facilitator superfamily (MFS) profile domain-containing protein n=1 Tax=Clathrus columnatus TaxID=1419009 RepID=A0AAV5AJ51_9AGAM|nr:hypothetical protein Clacol_008937 [Clathrus columnatus]